MRQRASVQVGNAVVAGVLCGLMALPPAMLADGPKTAIPAETHLTALTPEQKTLHALNRLTFGPRPGDEAMVAKMGLEAWFQSQLHPERIDDAAFEAQLAKFPAMQLTQEQLMRQFPGPQEIREMANRGGGMGMGLSDPAQRAVVADAIASYQERKKVEAGSAVVAGQAPLAAHDDETVMNPTPASKDRSPGTPDGAPGSGVGQAPSPTHPQSARMDGAPGSMSGQSSMSAAHDDETVMNGAPVDSMAVKKGNAKKDAAGVMGNADVQAERVQLMQGLTPAQMEIVAAMQGPGRVVGSEVLETRLLRDVESQRQLQAVMSDFWLNHFSVYIRKNQNELYYLPAYQNDVILPNALGNFEQLLVATAESPAMLMYLDNWASIGPDSPAATRIKRAQQVNPNGKIVKNLPKGINENYARELMELHTLGVGGGYTQQDVIEVAKCFTGWTIDRKYQGGMGSGSGQFIFEPNRHEGGSKTVLGHTIPEGGMNEGLEVLHILATSPATAKFVSTKLAVRFVSDTPPPALVDKMAATFVKSNGDIKAVLTTMFHAPEFWSPAVYRAKVKTPLEFMTSALRASDATVNNPLPLVQAMERLGMPVYGMQTPNGYSWKADEWVSSNALVARMNFALVLSAGRVPGTRMDWPTLLGDASAVAPTAATERRLETVVLGQAASDRTRETVLAQSANDATVATAEKSFNAAPVADDDAAAAGAGMMVRAKYGKGGARGAGEGFQAGPATPLDTMAGLLLGSPEFQRR
jgi:uncharacterized protein (DUF1800 family)